MNYVRQLGRTISKHYADHHLYKSYVGKRTDDVGFEEFKKRYTLGGTLTGSEKNEIAQKWGNIVRSPLSWG